MKRFQYKSILAIAILFSVAGCDHDTDPDGPNLVDRFGPFNVVVPLSVNTTSVDFTAGEAVIFTAQFNKNVDWRIEITGLQSGAVRRIEGFDREINAGNATWTGGTTILPFFKNEMCAVQLTVPEEPDFIDSAQVEIIGTKIYPGSLFTDFEDPPGQNIEFGNFEFELTNQSGRQNVLTAGQGDWYYFLEGTDNVVPNFFVGLANISSTITGQTYAPMPSTVPAQVFFNCLMYHDGSPNGIAVIQFAYDSNDNGVFDDGPDETFQLPGDFPLNWVGWRHIHHSMADVGISSEKLQKIVAIRLLLISDLNSQPNPPQPVRYGTDFITFTQGGPLQL